jgi:hypothetical protein
MKKIVCFLIMILFVNCASKNQNYNQLVGHYKYVNKLIPINQYFYLPEKYEYMKYSRDGKTLNRHYINLKNEDLDELRIGVFELRKRYKNGIIDENAFLENFQTQFSWLNNDKYTYENGVSDKINYIIYNVRNKNIEHTILFGTKNKKSIYIQFDNLQTEYSDEVEKVKAIFNKIIT